MAYDEGLAQRIREHLAEYGDVTERKMFGGLAFMVAGNMCCGVLQDQLMARVGEGYYAQALSAQHAREMDFTGRPMKGFVFVETLGIDMDEDLDYWVELCLDFNPRAQSSKKK